MSNNVLAEGIEFPKYPHSLLLAEVGVPMSVRRVAMVRTRRVYRVLVGNKELCGTGIIMTGIQFP